MSLNHKKIANTKYAINEIIKRMDQKRVDSFVNLLVEARPDEFEGTDEGSVVDPFVIIGLMVTDLDDQFTAFTNKIKKGEVSITDGIKERAKAKVIEFEAGMKKKGETTH